MLAGLLLNYRLMLQIVAVDDSQEDLNLLDRVLRQSKVLNPRILLHSGEQLIAFLQENQQPDGTPSKYLIFLDLMMAPMSGIAVLRFLKNLPFADQSLFVMVSGITDIKALNEGYQLGASTFMIKPVKPEDVMEVLHGLRNKIVVNETPEGHLLDWVATAGSGSTILPTTNRFGISLSA
jgi:CheY-like chemotaxis protein